MTVDELIKHLENIPKDADIFIGTYEEDEEGELIFVQSSYGIDAWYIDEDNSLYMVLGDKNECR